MSHILNKYSSILISLLISSVLISCNSGTSPSTTNTTPTPTPTTSSGILFGNAQGLVFSSDKLLPGNQVNLSGIDGGGSITAMASDSQGNIYAGTKSVQYYGGQVWKYLNGGTNWVRLGSGQLDYGAGITALSYNETRGLFAATSIGNVFNYSVVNNNWDELGSTGSLDGTSVNSLAVNDNNLYAGTKYGKVYSYTNENWSSGQSLDGSPVNSLAINTSGVLYAGTNDGNVYQYAGNTWNNIEPLADGAVNSIAIESNNIFVATESGHVWESASGGGGWVLESGNGALDTLDGTSVNSLTTDNSGNVYAGTEGAAGTVAGQVFKLVGESRNQLGNMASESLTQCIVNCQNNINASSLYESNPVLSLAVAPNGSIFAGLGDGSTYFNGQVMEYTPSTESWAITGSGSLGNQISAVTQDKYGNYYAVTTAPNAFKYVGESWVLLGDLFDVTNVDTCYPLVVDESGSLYTVNQDSNGQVFEYKNNQWVTIGILSNMNPAPPGNGNENATSAVVGQNGNVYFAVKPQYLSGAASPGFVWQYNPNNLTESWVLLRGTGESGSLDGSSPLALAMDNSGTLFAGTNAGNVYKYTQSMWESVGTNFGSPVTSLAIDAIGDLYAISSVDSSYTTNAVFKFSKGANSWEKLGGNINAQGGINSLTIDASGNIYVLTYYGTVLRYDIVSGWVNTGFGNGSEFISNGLALGL